MTILPGQKRAGGDWNQKRNIPHDILSFRSFSPVYYLDLFIS